MPKGQAPYVPVSRKLKSIGAELVEKGLIDKPQLKAAGEILRGLQNQEPSFHDYRNHKERDSQTQRFKSRKVD